jgi:hypothetical protein
MSLFKIVSIALGLAIVSSAAVAFQEQQGSQAPAATVAAPESKPAAAIGADATVLKPSAGTEVRIPGFGKLGNLPKMDFGLELLYGASEQKPVDAPVRDERDDLTIRGTVKHKF